MVVLSGCNTGSGKSIEGEGVLSLARSFLHSGCRTVVVSLWKEDDATGYRIIKEFYNYLQKGFPKDVCMQKSCLAYIEQSNVAQCHPYYWAGILLIGDVSKIELAAPDNKSLYWIFALIITFALVIFGLVIWRQIALKKNQK